MSGNITLPAASFAVLTTGLCEGNGPGESVLREAGTAAGLSLGADIAARNGTDLSSRRFWESAGAAVREAGLGSVGVESMTETWIVLAGTDLAEPEPHTFTAGLLEGLLSAVAGEPVAVAAAPTPELCRFVAGAPMLLQGIERRLRAGSTLEDAVRGDAEPD